MESILGIISILLIVLFIIGLFNPKKSLFWYKKKASRGMSALIYLGLLVLLSVVSGLFMNSDTKEVPYEIISETVTDVNSKVAIEIKVFEKINKGAIEEIAGKYQDKYGAEYKHVYIWFYIDDLKDCYATAHCEPDMEVKFLPMSDSKEKETISNFYTFEKYDPWTPGLPKNRMIKYLEYLRVGQWDSLAMMTKPDYADIKTVKQVLLPYEVVKGYNIDKVEESKFMSKVYFYLCYTLNGKDETKYFVTTLLRINEQGDPDVNQTWRVEPFFTQSVKEK